MGPDTGWKEKEYGEILFLCNSRIIVVCHHSSLITDENSDSSYSLHKIILDLFSVFFGLVEAVNSQPGSGAPPRSPAIKN